ncbi:MAG: hypothetical protein AB1568_09885 [Thermodesulfobacteriota bacterium]
MTGLILNISRISTVLIRYIFFAMAFFAPLRAVYAEETIVVDNLPIPFSVKPPESWRQIQTTTGNSRVRFSSPSGTPTAECAVIVKEISILKNFSQDELDSVTLESSDPSLLSNQLSSGYNNIQILGTGSGSVSGHLAIVVRYTGSTGTPDGELWTYGIITTTKTTPGLSWTISCGGLGFTQEEAKKCFSYWQSEMVNFSTHLKILE